MNNDQSIDRVEIKGKTFIIKEAIDDGGCYGCHNYGYRDLIKCEDVWFVIAGRINDFYSTRCGLGINILVEDTPEEITEYLFKKVNYEEGDEEDE